MNGAILRLDRLTKRFGAMTVSDEVTLDIAPGEFHALIGPNGAGKTTLIHQITGVLKSDSGTIAFNGADITRLSLHRRARLGLARSFQITAIIGSLTALENAVLPLDFARRGGKHERFERARQTLALVGLADKADRLPAELSGGEQQRVAIARALACDPPLIVGDEPTGNLDTATASEMIDLLGRLNAEGKTIVYVTHDLELAGRAHRTVTIRDGRVVG